MADVLPDVIAPGLRLLICGTAAGTESARVRQYYAGPGNKFWKTLHEVGLTPERLQPRDFARLIEYGIGLTDLAKQASGSDADLSAGDMDAARLERLVLTIKPGVLAFNGKQSAKTFLRRNVEYGAQPERIGDTGIFVLPSTSGAASGFWDPRHWRQLASLVQRDASDRREHEKPL